MQHFPLIYRFSSDFMKSTFSTYTFNKVSGSQVVRSGTWRASLKSLVFLSKDRWHVHPSLWCHKSGLHQENKRDIYQSLKRRVDRGALMGRGAGDVICCCDIKVVEDDDIPYRSSCLLRQLFPGHRREEHVERWNSVNVWALEDRRTRPLQPHNLVCSGPTGAADLWHRGGRGGRQGQGGRGRPPRAVFRRTAEAQLGGGVSPGDATARPLRLPVHELTVVTWRSSFLMMQSRHRCFIFRLAASEEPHLRPYCQQILIPHREFSKRVSCFQRRVHKSNQRF